MAKKVIVGGRIESKEVGGIVTGAAEILDDTKGKKQSVINQETDNELARLDQSKQDNLTFDNVPTEGSNNPVKSAGVYAADKALSDAIEAILLLIPGAASALNKLVDMATMNSSISTATATFKGTYNVVTDLELAIDATHEQIAAKLAQVVSEADNNDYAFVQIPVSAESTDIRRTERYKFNGTAWAYEYDINTSGFTAAQWAAINSGITIALVGKLIGLPTSSELQALIGQKQDTLTFDNVPTAGSNNPVKSGGINTAISNETEARQQLAQSVDGINGRLGNVEGVIPSTAAANNKLVANNSMEAYVSSIIEAITASFTIATSDGHINLTLTQTNGRVASLTLTSSDIASAQALTALTGRVSTAEGNITSLGGRVSTNETDIANLQQLYNNLQQSKPVAVTALPETGQQQGVIYRLAGTTSYSDYMWNGSTWVLMATYNNAIDPRPKKASQNLVTSGGVFDNMGALDVSELNATENPHTLAQYVDLSAALAAIPTDYQKGGMSIKFVQSSDNKYVQYRLMADTFNTTPANWQGVDDEPTAGSDNLVKSGGITRLYGIYEKNELFNYVLVDSDKRIYFGITKDGRIIWYKGIPYPIKVFVENLLLGKVDKEAGKSLIDTDISNSFSYIGNNLFSFVVLDADERIIFGYTKTKKILYYGTTPYFVEKAIEKALEDFDPAGIREEMEEFESVVNEKVLVVQNGLASKLNTSAVVSVVENNNNNPVSSQGVKNAIEQAQILAADVTITEGLNVVTVAASNAPQSVKEVCNFVCDGIDDQVEINAAIASINDGGEVKLTNGRFNISSPIILSKTLNFHGETGVLNLKHDTYNETYTEGTVLQATNGITDIIQVQDNRGTLVHELGIYGWGRNKSDNRGCGINITGYSDMGRFYNLNIFNCYIAIASFITIDQNFFYNNSIQRNKLGMFLFHTASDIHDNIFCENIGIQTITFTGIEGGVSTEYTWEINCGDIVDKYGCYIYNNTFKATGMCYDIDNSYGNASGLESDDVNPISSVVLYHGPSVARIIKGNNFAMRTYGNCIRVNQKINQLNVIDNYFGTWGKNELDDEYKAAICFAAGAVKTVIAGNVFNSWDTQVYASKYAVYEKTTGDDSKWWNYSVIMTDNKMINLSASTPNDSILLGTDSKNVIQNNIIIKD